MGRLEVWGIHAKRGVRVVQRPASGGDAGVVRQGDTQDPDV